MSVVPVHLQKFGAELAFSTLGNGLLYTFAHVIKQQVLTNGGLLHALVLGIILGGTVGLRGWGLCVLLFFTGSSLTRFRRGQKEALGIAEARGGRRKAKQVWGAAGAGACTAVLSKLCLLYGNLPGATALQMAYCCSIASKMSDTAASEVGKAYPGKKTYLISTLKEVKPGTDGAISVNGTLAGVAISLVAALYAWTTGLVLQTSGIAVIVVAALIATTAESFLGAVYQRQYAMSNELVNFVQCSIAAVVGGVMYLLV